MKAKGQKKWKKGMKKRRREDEGKRMRRMRKRRKREQLFFGLIQFRKTLKTKGEKENETSLSQVWQYFKSPFRITTKAMNSIMTLTHFSAFGLCLSSLTPSLSFPSQVLPRSTFSVLFVCVLFLSISSRCEQLHSVGQSRERTFFTHLTQMQIYMN